MKAATHYTSAKVIPYRSRRTPSYPNEAGKQYQLNRVLDYALTAATSAGVVTALLFLFTIL